MKTRNILPLAVVGCALPLLLAAVFLTRRNQGEQRASALTTATPSPTQTPLSWGGPLQPPRFDPYAAPAFRLSTIGGGMIANETVNGKPTILWFTTTYCVPCQLGAEEVEKLDDDLGGSAFHVVMIFIDPRETDADLLVWKKNFANEDWYMAHGNEQLLKDYNIRSLDTQYLLDKDGKVREVNYGLVGYDDYKQKFTPLL